MSNTEIKTDAAVTEEAVKEAPQPENQNTAEGAESSEVQEVTAAKDDAPEKEPRKLTAYEQELANRKKMNQDRGYRSSRSLYRVGMILLFILLLGNCIRNLTGIELIVNQIVVTPWLYLSYLIPCVMMLIGLIRSRKIAAGFGVRDGSRGGIVIVGVAIALIAVLGVLNIVEPSYHVYEMEQVELRDGQAMTMVKYIKVPVFSKARETLPGNYMVDVYKTNGIFHTKLITAEAILGKSTVEKGSGERDYKLCIRSSINAEEFPFEYK